MTRLARSEAGLSNLRAPTTSEASASPGARTILIQPQQRRKACAIRWPLDAQQLSKGGSQVGKGVTSAEINAPSQAWTCNQDGNILS